MRKPVVEWKIINHLQGRINAFELCQVCKEKIVQLQLRYGTNAPFFVRSEAKYRTGQVETFDHFPASTATDHIYEFHLKSKVN